VNAIGNTPLTPTRIAVGGEARTVHLKLEGTNPCGSLKDRTAQSLVADLERREELGEDSILVESTSGNLGVSLAWIARRHGYPFVAVVDPKTTPELLLRLRRLGAAIELVDTPDEAGGYLLSRLERVGWLCASSDRFVWPNQYENPANPRAHELGTGPEILEQMGAVDAVFVAVSTGGTLAGIARCFRRESAATHVVAVDAVGSVALGGEPAARLLTGIGASRRSTFVSRELYDERVLIGDAEAFACCRRLAAEAGLFVGGSSGAVLAACARVLATRPELERVVCVCADGGERYRSTIFDDRWIARHLTDAQLAGVTAA
jgi:cysteine synthase A